MELAVQAGSEADKVFQIDRPLMIVGRQVGTEIQINDSQVSRRHLQLENRGGALYVTDLNSANGSYINGRRLVPNQTELLRPGDNLRVGDTSLLLRGIAAHQSSTEATSVAGSYQAATQIQSPPPDPVQPPPQSNNYNNNAGSSYPPPTFGNAPVPVSHPNQPQNYANSSGQVGNYNQPPNYNNNSGQTGYPVAPFVPSGYNPNQPYAPSQNQGVAPLPAAKPRPNRTGLVAVLAVLLIAIVGGGIFGLVNLLNNNPKPTPTAQAIVLPDGSSAPANNTPANLGGNDTPNASNSTPSINNSISTVAINNGTSVPNLTSTIARGNIGNNVPPPSPPKPTAVPPTVAPATTVRVATASAITPKPTTSAAGSGSLVPVKALGVTISFPADWQTKTDTTKTEIFGVATDNTTLVELIKTSKFSGAVTSRANTVLDGTKTTYPDLVVTKPLATDSNGRAVVEYEYTDTSGGSNTLQHERMAVFQDPADSTITYFVFYSTSKDLFASQEATFQAIANSIGFAS